MFLATRILDSNRHFDEKYPFWHHEYLHPTVKQFYVWLACYNEDYDFVRQLATRIPDSIIGILPMLHIFDQQELIDEINGGELRLEYMNNIINLRNVDSTGKNTSSLLSLLRSRPSLSDRQYCKTKFVDNCLAKPKLPPSKVMLEIVQELGNEKIDLTYDAGYTYACRNLWSSEIENLDINDPFKPAAHRVAKAIALGLSIPDNIFNTSN